ncbi:MAG: amidohydrolase family protein [Gemmatimonadota bacterium]
MIIDSHLHAGRADALAHSWDTFADIEVSLRRMDGAGIDRGVVLPIGSGGFRQRNRETAALVAAHVSRLWGYAKVSQEEDRGQVGDLLDEAFGELGLRGLKLHGHPNREIMEALQRHRKPLLVDVFGKVYGLRYVAESYPEIPLIVAHMGQFKSSAEAHQVTLWLAQEYPNVYFDTSSVLEHEWLERAAAAGLCHKMIFGSDGPVCHCGVELARVKSLALPPGDEDAVLRGNIAALLEAD